MRYDVDGSLDSGFGDAGMVTTVLGSNSRGEAILLQADGRFLVAGQAEIDGRWVFALARYQADGTLDASFGDGGTVTAEVGDGHAYAYSVAVQPGTNKIVVGGYAYDSVNHRFDFAVARFWP